MKSKSSKKPKALLRVEKGALVPYDKATVDLLRSRQYKIGDILSAELRKPRNPRFHRLAHSLGEIIAHNIEAFSGCDAHSVLKRIQIEGNIACDEMSLNFQGIGPCTYRIPQSLSFDSMDDGEFHQVIEQMCNYISRTYWPSVSPERIEQMAELWVIT